MSHKNTIKKCTKFMVNELTRYFETNVFFTQQDILRIKIPYRMALMPKPEKSKILQSALQIIVDNNIAECRTKNDKNYFKSLIYDENVYVPSFKK